MPKTKNPCKDIPGYDERGNQLERGGPSRKAEWQKKWRDKNKEYIKSYNAGYYLTHTVKKRVADAKAAKNKIKERKAELRREVMSAKPFTHTMEELRHASVDIIFDREINHMTLAALALKYNTNRRAIGRILDPNCK